MKSKEGLEKVVISDYWELLSTLCRSNSIDHFWIWY